MPDLAILDVCLPALNRNETCREGCQAANERNKELMYYLGRHRSPLYYR